MNSKTIITGAVSGLILGLAQMLLLGSSIDTLIIPIVLGILIALVAARLPIAGTILGAVAAGAIIFAISALITDYLVMDHTILGAINGLLIGLIMAFVTPKLIG